MTANYSLFLHCGFFASDLHSSAAHGRVQLSTFLTQAPTCKATGMGLHLHFTWSILLLLA